MMSVHVSNDGNRYFAVAKEDGKVIERATGNTANEAEKAVVKKVNAKIRDKDNYNESVGRRN